MEVPAIFVATVLACCSGCGTVSTGFDRNPYPVYGGVRQDARNIGDGGFAIILVVDVPLSFAVDTLLLPLGLYDLTLLPPSVDPLKDWKSWSQWDEESHPASYGFHGTILVERARLATHSPLDKAIKDDYQKYLQKHEPGYFGDLPSFYENGTGQHAVKIQIGRNGYYRVYIFIYDKSNVRTKIIRYANGGYAC